VPTPWETTEAHLALAWCLKHDLQSPVRPLLLKLSNLNRINSFHFYPATYSPAVAALDPVARQDPGRYWPIEAFYTLEGNGGHRGPTAAYMAGNAVWNWWLYEALGEADDREVMVLNLDALDDYEPAIRSAVRHWVVYNPTLQFKQVKLIAKSLAPGEYTAECDTDGSNSGPLACTADALTAGWPLAVPPQGAVRVTLRHRHSEALLAAIRRERTAQRRLSQAYATLQARSWSGADAVAGERYAQQFREALQEYRAGRHEAAADGAERVTRSVRSDGG
jgi:hypothetical protein